MLLPAAPLEAFERTRDDYGHPVFWPGAVVIPEAPDALGPDAPHAVEQALRRWQKAPCARLRIEHAETSPIRLLLVKEGWSHGPSEVAYTSLDVDRSSGQIQGVLMELNGSFRFGTGKDEIDLEALLTHEFGHALGLAHSFDRGAVMHAGRHRGAAKSELQADDMAGICAIYPRHPGPEQSGHAWWFWAGGAFLSAAVAIWAVRNARRATGESGKQS